MTPVGASSSTDAAQIGVWGLAAAAILIVVAVVVSLWRRLGLERSMLWAALRALGQLIVVGFALQLVVPEEDADAASTEALIDAFTSDPVRKIIDGNETIEAAF